MQPALLVMLLEPVLVVPPVVEEPPQVPAATHINRFEPLTFTKQRTSVPVQVDALTVEPTPKLPLIDEPPVEVA
jgi:hypothetical protein